MDIQELKSRVQLLSDSIDNIIKEFIQDLPDGVDVLVMKKGDIPNWGGITGKYLDIGISIPKELID